MVPLKQLLLLPLLALLLSSCGLSYYSKIAWHQSKIIFGKKDIHNLLEGTSLTDQEKAKLQLILELREYAKEHGLKVGSNYQDYYALDDKYVSYVVNASPAFSLEPYTWGYPLVGKLSYKGFPDKLDAETEAFRLESLGYDVYTRGVRAYSTLGWFSDPVLSSMLDLRDTDLVQLIFHESTHTTLYIDSNADFNEQLASYVSEKLTEAYLEKKYGAYSNEYRSFLIENREEKIFRNFMKQQLNKLSHNYSLISTEKINLQKKKEIKQSHLQAIVRQYQEQIKPQLKILSYDFLEKENLNNAQLSNFATYQDYPPEFDKIYEQSNSEVSEFLKTISNLKDSKSPYRDIKKLIR